MDCSIDVMAFGYVHHLYNDKTIKEQQPKLLGFLCVVENKIIVFFRITYTCMCINKYMFIQKRYYIIYQCSQWHSIPSPKITSNETMHLTFLASFDFVFEKKHGYNNSLQYQIQIPSGGG